MKKWNWSKIYGVFLLGSKLPNTVLSIHRIDAWEINTMNEEHKKNRKDPSALFILKKLQHIIISYISFYFRLFYSPSFSLWNIGFTIQLILNIYKINCNNCFYLKKVLQFSRESQIYYFIIWNTILWSRASNITKILLTFQQNEILYNPSTDILIVIV